MLNRTQAPAFKQVNEIKFLHPEQSFLDNGIPVYAINSGEQDLVRIEFIFDNVNWQDDKPLQAMATSTMLNNGTKYLTAKEIAEKIDFYGAFFQTEYGNDQSTVTLYTLNKHLASVLPIVHEVLSESVFPQSELDIYVQNQKQKLQVNLKKNDVVARKQFAQALFGNTSYGYNITAKNYDDLHQDELTAYFNAAYTPKNCTIIASGKFDKQSLNIINQYFGQEWGGIQQSTINDFSFNKVNGKPIYIEKADALQSAIRMGKIAINRTHPDFAGFQVLNCVLGGYFGSRLMANIREDKGYTYGIGSGVASMKDAGYFFIATEVGADVCTNALTEIYKEIDLLKQELISEAELSLVQNYMLGSMLGSLENVFSHADKFKNIHFFGLGYDYYTNYIQTVKNITANDIQKLANKYLATDDFTEVVVGKK